MNVTDLPTYAAPIGPTAWRLTAIGHTGGVCDHCGRTLKHTYTVIDPRGKTQTLGRTHVKAATGYNLSQAEAARILECEARNAARAARWATWATDNPDTAALLLADINAWITWWNSRTGKNISPVTTEWNGAASGAGPAAEVRDWIADGRPTDQFLPSYLGRRARGEFVHAGAR